MIFLKWGRKGFLITLLFLAPFSQAWGNPDVWFDWTLQLQASDRYLNNTILQILEPHHLSLVQQNKTFPIHEKFLGPDNRYYELEIDGANIEKRPHSNDYFNRIAILYSLDTAGNKTKQTEVLWDTRKTGVLPGPESLLIRSHFSWNGLTYNFSSFSEEMTIQGHLYYKNSLQYSLLGADQIPLKRGVAEIFQDVEKQQTKILTSLVEGPSDINPKEMLQINVQTIIGSKGYVYLKEDQSDPLSIPEDQQHYCKNPQGDWVEKNSREWDENCVTLFDNNPWHGFSYSSLPPSYSPFLN